MGHVTQATPLSGMVVVRRLTVDIGESATTQSDDAWAILEIFQGVWNSRMSRGPDHAHLGDSWSSEG